MKAAVAAKEEADYLNTYKLEHLDEVFKGEQLSHAQIEKAGGYEDQKRWVEN